MQAGGGIGEKFLLANISGHTVVVADTINFSPAGVQLLIKGGFYSRAAFILISETPQCHP